MHAMACGLHAWPKGGKFGSPVANNGGHKWKETRQSTDQSRINRLILIEGMSQRNTVIHWGTRYTIQQRQKLNELKNSGVP